MPSVASLATRFEGNFKVGQPLRLRIPKHVSICYVFLDQPLPIIKKSSRMLKTASQVCSGK